MADSTSTHRILNIDAHQLGRMLGLLYAALGILIGVVLVLAGLFGAEEWGIIIFGLFAPIIYGIIGYVSGLIGGILFNWTAGKLGGLRVTIATDEAGELNGSPGVH